ncbi:hypothetical protein NFI96_003756, partial [Prochilodus magdalenae]
QLDIWSKSNYQVFQKVTDHATTALLHYQLPQMPDVVVRSFMLFRVGVKLSDGVEKEAVAQSGCEGPDASVLVALRMQHVV